MSFESLGSKQARLITTASPTDADELRRHLLEKCGVCGYATIQKGGEDPSSIVLRMLKKLQNRGRDAAGIASSSPSSRTFSTHLDLGLVADAYPGVFNPCDWGIHIPSSDELLLNQYRNVRSDPDYSKVLKHFGLASIHFLSVEALQKVADQFGIKLCIGCSTGEYEMPRISNFDNRSITLS